MQATRKADQRPYAIKRVNLTGLEKVAAGGHAAWAASQL